MLRAASYWLSGVADVIIGITDIPLNRSDTESHRITELRWARFAVVGVF